MKRNMDLIKEIMLKVKEESSVYKFLQNVGINELKISNIFSGHIKI